MRRGRCTKHTSKLHRSGTVSSIDGFSSLTKKKDSISWTGRIHCRLSSPMAEQFRSLSRSGRPEFRLCQQRKTPDILVSSITTNFDLRTFSSPSKFEAETEEFVIEVKMHRWPGWERISAGLQL
jgi:hypothetical protein